ncbi:MAG: DMT family transporter, partial [Hyphomicrobium sp.]
STSPVMIAVVSYLVNGERVTARQMAGITVSLAGVLVVLGKGDAITLTRLAFNVGDLIMLGAMAVWALYTAMLDKRPPINMVSFAAVTFVIAAVLNVPLAAIELASGAPVSPGSKALAAIAYIAIFPSFLAYLLFNRGVEIIGPTRAGAFMHLVPLFTAVLAILFLGEQFAAYHALALALILSGVWLAAR